MAANAIRFRQAIPPVPPTVADHPAANTTDVLVAKICIAVMLFFAAIGLTPPAIFGGGELTADGGGGVVIKQAAYLVLFGVSLLLATRHSKERFSLWIPLGLATMLIWIWASLGWSAVPGIAIRRIVITTIVIVSTFLLTRVARPKSAFDFLSWFFLVVILIDIAASLTLPGAISVRSETDNWSSSGGTWRGVHLEKNGAGALGATAVLLFIYRACDSSSLLVKRLGWAAMTPLSMLFVYMTGSKTSFALVPLVCILAVGCVVIGGRRRILALIALLLAIAVAMTIILLPDLVPNLQRDFAIMLQDPRSFTGRSQIWALELRFARDHFFFGSGYGSFWAVGESGPLYHYGTGWLQTIPAGHNGYFDIRAQTGAIGLAIAILAAILIPMILMLVRIDLDLRLRWIIAAQLWFFSLHNFLETSLFDRDNLIWVVTLVALATLALRKNGNDPARLRLAAATRYNIRPPSNAQSASPKRCCSGTQRRRAPEGR